MRVTIEIGADRKISVDLRDFSILRYFNIEFTSTCNLRCTYCAVSDLAWKGRDVSPETLEASITIASGNSSIQPARTVVLGCTSVGEITTMRNWTALVQPYVDLAKRGSRVTILSNLQKTLSDDEIDTFTRFHAVSFSLDTIDAETLGKVRRKANLANITMNLMKIRARAIETGRPQPFLTLNCVVTDLNATQILALGSFAAACGVKRLYLIDLKDSDIDDPTILHRPRKVSTLPKDELLEFADQVRRARVLMKRHGGTVVASGVLRPLIETLQGGSALPTEPASGETRICTQLWDTLFIRADGGVKHCCGPLESGARLDRCSPDQIVNNPTVREWREALLTGKDIPEMCRTCHWARPGSVRELRESVARLHAVKSIEANVEPEAGAASGEEAEVDIGADAALEGAITWPG